jgi:hypothetical protein
MDSENLYSGYDTRTSGEIEEKYRRAVALYNKEGFRNLIKAKKLFVEIGPYKDAPEYLNNCEIIYEEAERPYKARRISKWIKTVIEVLLHSANLLLWSIMVIVYIIEAENDRALFVFMCGMAFFSLMKLLFNIVFLLPPMDEVEDSIPGISMIGKGNWAVQTFVRLLIQFIITVVCVVLIFAVGVIITMLE